MFSEQYTTFQYIGTGVCTAPRFYRIGYGPEQQPPLLYHLEMANYDSHVLSDLSEEKSDAMSSDVLARDWQNAKIRSRIQRQAMVVDDVHVDESRTYWESEDEAEITLIRKRAACDRRLRPSCAFATACSTRESLNALRACACPCQEIKFKL